MPPTMKGIMCSLSCKHRARIAFRVCYRCRFTTLICHFIVVQSCSWLGHSHKFPPTLQACMWFRTSATIVYLCVFHCQPARALSRVLLLVLSLQPVTIEHRPKKHTCCLRLAFLPHDQVGRESLYPPGKFTNTERASREGRKYLEHVETCKRIA